jgi:hypothetical protein
MQAVTRHPPLSLDRAVFSVNARMRADVMAARHPIGMKRLPGSFRYVE